MFRTSCVKDTKTSAIGLRLSDNTHANPDTSVETSDFHLASISRGSVSEVPHSLAGVLGTT